jgi:hypothetical protein
LRNRKIARIARAFREGRREELAKALPGMELMLDDGPLRDIVVFVENLEHGLALARLLPNSSLWTGENVNEDGLSPDQGKLLHPPPHPFQVGPFTAIVTAGGVRNVIMSDVDVLIRADGGIGLPPFGLTSLIEPDQSSPRPLLLVDFNDCHSPVLRRRSNRRKHAYDGRGWQAPGKDPKLCRVELFLASRPERTRS